jgi:hypothetical protein
MCVFKIPGFSALVIRRSVMIWAMFKVGIVSDLIKLAPLIAIGPVLMGINY